MFAQIRDFFSQHAGTEQAQQPQQDQQQDFGSNAAMQEQMRASKRPDEVSGRVTDLSAVRGGTRVKVGVGPVPGFNVYWTAILAGGRKGHYMLDLAEPRSGHGERTEWDYDGHTVTFVLPYSLDQVRAYGQTVAFKPGKHAIGRAADQAQGEAAGRLVGLQRAASGNSRIKVSVRGGTDNLNGDWTAIVGGDGYSLRDATFRGDIATFEVERGYDQVLNGPREVRFVRD